MVNRQALSDLAEDLCRVLKVLGRHEHRDVLADDFLGGVAERALGPPVPTGDDAFEIFTDDRFFRRFDDRSQAARCRLDAFSFRDIQKHVDRTDHFSRRIQNRIGIRQNVQA